MDYIILIIIKHLTKEGYLKKLDATKFIDINKNIIIKCPT